MEREIRVYVACGSGIATSSVACESVRELCKKEGIIVEVEKGTLEDIPLKEGQVDLILTTARYKKECKVPLLCITSFITGIGEEKTSQELLSVLLEIKKKL